MPQVIDLTPVWEEGMAVNHLYHPRSPVMFPNQRYFFTKHFLGDVWREGGAPIPFDGLPADWTNPDTQRGFADEELMINTHLGTHIDAGSHFNPDSKQDAAAIPVEKCIGMATMLDFRHMGPEPFKITVKDLEEAERKSGHRVGKGEIAILHTGWMARWGVGPGASRERYGDCPNPGLDIDAPEWFIDRGVNIVGGDMPNIDYDMTSGAHINWLCREAAGKEPIQIVENLAYLERVPSSRFLFIGLPFPIVGGTGSPIRAVAVVGLEWA